MGLLRWFGDNWSTVVQSAGIVGSLLFTGAALKLDAKSRRVVNLLTITQQYREIWSELYQRPELARVSQARVNLEEAPITVEEELFVRLLMQHLNSAYRAMASGVFLEPAGVRKNARRFFSRPIPKAVWIEWRPFQDEAFVRFVEGNSSLGQCG